MGKSSSEKGAAQRNAQWAQEKREERESRHFPLGRLFPSFVTLMGLCAGLSAIRFALEGRFAFAVAAIIAAAIFDGMDGRLARLLKATSTFGAQLDSLADFMSFGVAPAVVLYLWSMQQMGGRGWAVVLLFAVCCAIRLARFNTAAIDRPKKDTKPAKPDKFFVGMPAPMAACVSLFFLVLSFEYTYGWLRDPLLNAAYLSFIALMMASRIPTVSIKRLQFKLKHARAILVFFGLLMALLLIEPWLTLVAIAVGYFTSIPLTAYIVWKNQSMLDE